MAAVLVAMHGHGSRRDFHASFKTRERTNSEEQIIQSQAVFELTANPQEKAAMAIQQTAGNRLLGLGNKLRRKPLLERMSLELELIWGLRMLVLCSIMFVLVIYAAVIESQGPRRLGLLSTYQSLFQLDDGLAEVKTSSDLLDLLRTVSQTSRQVMPLSSENFVEDSGEVKLLPGKRRFRRTLMFNSEDIDPRISSPSFTFTAWIQIPPGDGGTIIRKPLGNSLVQKDLSCWGWYEGYPTSKFTFGAHDFRGGASPDKEEVAIGTHTSAADDGKWHLMAVVVNATTVEFYQDAVLQSSVPILRPVTDCSGRLLEIGSPSIPRMGELTFFARSLARSEMAEIAVTGFTLENVAAGKVPFTPSTTDVDDLKASMETSFAAAASHNAQVQDSVAVESILNRGTVTTALSPETAPVVKRAPRPPVVSENCVPDKWYAGSSCHIIMDLHNSTHVDATGKTYYNMLPPSVRGGAAHNERLFVDWGQPGGYVTYDATTFPSWCGGSATFMLWLRSDSALHPGYVIRPYDKDSKVPWSLFALAGGVDSYGDKFPGSLNTLYPPAIGRLFEEQPKTYPLRHVTAVFDSGRNSFRAYLDGALVEEILLDKSTADVADFDCWERSPDDYIAVFHRQPGAWNFKADVQDFRMYVGEALSPEEIHDIAFPARQDATLGPQRGCQTSAEGGDTAWTDALGHPCSWYETMRKVSPRICLDEEVRRACPVACQSTPSCHEAAEEEGENGEQRVYERVMHLTERRKHQGVLCVRQGLDVVAECRDRRAANDPGSYPPGWAGPWEPTGRFEFDSSWPGWHVNHVPQADINVTDCELLEKVVDPLCAFATPAAWTESFHAKVQAENALTVTMWVKLLSSEFLPSVAGTRTARWDQHPRRIKMLSRVAPPKSFMDMAIMADGTMQALVYFPGNKNWDEEVTVNAVLEPDTWIFLALSIGVPHPDTGMRSMLGMADSAVLFDLLVSAGEEWRWEADASNDVDFLQAIQFPGDVLVSPISFLPKARGQKQLQALYYAQKVDQVQRRGPRNTDEDRLTERIEYERQAYPYPAVLVAPPVVLQQRAQATSACVHALGGSYIQDLWQRTVDGVTCGPPYECPAEVLAEAKGLLSCTSPTAPPFFFGQKALQLGGELQFAEFLQSVADASILVREGEAHETQNFLDGLTRTVSVAMVGLSPDYGIASTISITAQLEADVKVDFTVEHFQSLEGAQLREYRVVAFLGIAVALVILAEKVLSARSGRDNNYVLLGVDVLVQVLLPIAYFSLRYSQIANSRNVIAETVGREGLGGVPWASTEVPMEEKMTSFFDGMEALSAKVGEERLMAVFYSVHATICLLRLIAQTSIHPRLSILVGTIRNAASDLWHFLLLLLVLYGGFLALAMAQFAGQRSEFATPLSTFETLYDMMLGSLPASGDIPSQFWAYDPLILIFALTYNFLVFMIMLNFIIAIIVEAYMKVVEEIQGSETNQEFTTDCVSVIVVTAKALFLRWPSHGQLMHKLEASAKETIGYMELRKLVPGLKSKSLRTFLQHYARYEYMHPKMTPRNHRPRYAYMTPDEGGAAAEDLKLCDAVDELEKRVALMLKTPVPTLGQKMMTSKAVGHVKAKAVDNNPEKKRGEASVEVADVQRVRSGDDRVQLQLAALQREVSAMSASLEELRRHFLSRGPPPAAPVQSTPEPIAVHTVPEPQLEREGQEHPAPDGWLHPSNWTPQNIHRRMSEVFLGSEEASGGTLATARPY